MTNEKKICRACACETSDYRSLHKKGLMLGEVTTLAQLLSYCTNLEFPIEETELPTVVCDNCIQKLARAYKFKQQVLQANESLRAIESTEITLDEVYNSVNDQERYVVVGVVHTKEGEEEFIISKQVATEDTILTYSVDELEIDEKDVEVQENEVMQNTVIDEKEEDEDEDEEEEEEEDQESEHLEINIENGSLQAERRKKNDLNLTEVKSLKGSVHNFALELSEDDENQSQDDMMSEVDIENTQSDSQSRNGSRAQSQELDVENDSTVNKKLMEMLPKLKPVKTRKIKSKPKEINPDLQCQVCGKQLSNTNSYRYHMQLHSDDTPFLCSLCGEGFKTRNAYDGHKVLHDPNNPNKCDICGKTYRQPSSLRAHMLIHTGERPFVCGICGKGMTQKSGYKKHMLTHTGEKPHACDLCGREFRYSSNLISHRRSHTGEKPYECTHCNKCFTSSEQLKRHKLVHTGERPFKCKLCDKRFKRRSSLAAHQHTHNDTDDATTSNMLIESGEKIVKSKIVEIY